MPADDMAEKILSALTAAGLEAHVVLSGASRHGKPFILVRAEGSPEVWTLPVEGPTNTVSADSAEGIALLAQSVGLTSD